MTLTSQKLQSLKQTLTKYPADNPTHIFTIGKKQSASSYFSNERLLYIDVKMKTINYANIGKEEPFAGGRVPEAKGSINLGSQTFKYLRVKQKQPTIKLWEEKSVDESSKKLQEWKFQFFNLDVLLELINIINYIYNSSRSTPKHYQRSQVEQLQPSSGKDGLKQEDPAKNNFLNANNLDPNLRPATVYTPSTQKIVSQVQSPIHKLDNFQDGDNKFKYSQAYEKQGHEADGKNLQPIKENKKEEFGEHLKAHSLEMADKNKMKSSAFSQPDIPNKKTPQLLERYPTSKEQKSYYDPRYQNMAERTQKSNVLVPPLNMTKLNNVKQEKKQDSKYNQRSKKEEEQEQYEQEDFQSDYNKIPTENILNQISKTQNKSKINKSGNPRKMKNPLEIEISSIEYYEDKDNEDPEGFEGIQGQRSKFHQSIGSFGQTESKKNQSEGIGFHMSKEKLETDQVLDQLKANNKTGQSRKNKIEKEKQKRSAKEDYVDWNRLFQQSNYSIEVYQKFTQTCEKTLKQSILSVQLPQLILSTTPLTTLQSSSILFTVHKHSWPTQETPKPVIHLRDSKANPEYQTLADLYCRICNQRERLRRLWDSNRWVMEGLLGENLGKGGGGLVERLCGGLACSIQYLGFLVYCEAELDEEHYELKSNWEVLPNIRKSLNQLQQLIHLQLPNQTFKIHQRLYSPSSYIITLTSPIHLLHSSPTSPLLSYINPTTLQKNLSPSTSSLPTVFNTLAIRTLQESIWSDVENSLGNCINKGYDLERMGRIWAISGAVDYWQLMEYYNVGRDRIGDLYALIHVPFYRQLIASQLAAHIFSTLFTYIFHQELPLLPPTVTPTVLPQIEDLYRELAYVWLDHLLSFNGMPSEMLWKYIANVMGLVYGVQIGNKVQDTLPGYVMDFGGRGIGVRVGYWRAQGQGQGQGQESRLREVGKLSRSRSRSRSQSRVTEIIRNNHEFPLSLSYSYIQSNILAFTRPNPNNQSQSLPDTIEPYAKLHGYRASKFALIFSVLEEKVMEGLLESRMCWRHNVVWVRGGEGGKVGDLTDVDVEGIVKQLTVKSGLPAYLDYLQPYIMLYMSQSVPFQNSKKYEQLRIYNPDYLPILCQSSLLSLTPHSFITLQLYLRILSTLLTPSSSPSPSPALSTASYLFSSLCQQNSFWQSEFNPYITQLYTAFSNYHVREQDYGQAIKYYKSAMVIYIKSYPDSVFVADRHCYLAELLAAIGRYGEAVKELEYGIVRFQRYCRVEREVEEGEERDQLRRESKTSQYRQKQNKLLMLKYIKSTIKRSKLLLKSTKNTAQFQRYSNNFYTSDQLGQIIDPLYSILNELKQTNEISASNAIKRSFETLNGEGYSASKPCFPFIRMGVLGIGDIAEEVVEIFQLVLRVFVLSSKLPQITVFVGEYILNTNILQALALNMNCFKKVLKILLFYELQISSVARRSEDSLIFTMLLEDLEDKGKPISEVEAYTYIFHKYVKDNRGHQPYSDKAEKELEMLSREYSSNGRERARSPTGTSKKTERPMIILFLKRITESLKKIRRIYEEIKTYKIIQKHIPLSHGTKSESQELIILLEAIAALVGFDYLLSLAQNDEEKYYQSNAASRKKILESQQQNRSSSEDDIAHFAQISRRRY